MFNGKLVFRGKLNEECSRYLKKKRIIEGIIACGGTFIGTSPIIICLAFAISDWMFLSLIPLFMMCLINVLFYDESFKSEPDEIDINIRICRFFKKCKQSLSVTSPSKTIIGFTHFF